MWYTPKLQGTAQLISPWLRSNLRAQTIIILQSNKMNRGGEARQTTGKIIEPNDDHLRFHIAVQEALAIWFSHIRYLYHEQNIISRQVIHNGYLFIILGYQQLQYAYFNLLFIATNNYNHQLYRYSILFFLFVIAIPGDCNYLCSYQQQA